MSAGIDLASLLIAQLQLNEQQRQHSLPSSFDVALAAASLSDPTPPSSSLITSISSSSSGRYLTNSRRPLCTSLSVPETAYPTELLANTINQLRNNINNSSNNRNVFANVVDEQLYNGNCNNAVVDEVCHSWDGLPSAVTRNADRRCCSVGDNALPPLQLGRQILCSTNSTASSSPSPATASAASTTTTSPARYKTELCRPFEEHGTCRYGTKCQFAHGRAELRNVSRHPKYKTDLCRTFHSTGLCPYGPRCHFVHNEEERGTEILYTAAEHQQHQQQQKQQMSADASSLIRQRQLLRQQLTGATADVDLQLAARRRTAAPLGGLRRQWSVFESDEDELPDDLVIFGGAASTSSTSRVEPPRDNCPSARPWDLPLPQQPSLARRVSVADPMYHFQQQQQQQQPAPRTTRLQSLGMISPPGFEGFTPSAPSIMGGNGGGAARSIGSAAESSISSTASSVSDGLSPSPSPTLGLFLAEDPVWQQQGPVVPHPTAAAAPAVQLPQARAADWRSSCPPPSAADASTVNSQLLQTLLSQLPPEKIMDLYLAVNSSSATNSRVHQGLAASAVARAPPAALSAANLTPPPVDPWLQPFTYHDLPLSSSSFSSTNAVW